MQEFPPFDAGLNAVSPAGLHARMKMAKSKSQGDSVDDDTPLYATTTPTGRGRTRPRSPQYHFYEEVQPKLTYVDIDLTKNKRYRDRTAK